MQKNYVLRSQSRRRLQKINSRIRSQPKTGRLRNPAYSMHFSASISLLCVLFLLLVIPQAVRMGRDIESRREEERLSPKKRELHKLPYGEIVKSGDIFCSVCYSSALSVYMLLLGLLLPTATLLSNIIPYSNMMQLKLNLELLL